MQCPVCASVIDGDSRFCTQCGVPLRSVVPEEGRKGGEAASLFPELLEDCGESPHSSFFCVSWLRVGTFIGAATVIVVAVLSTVLFTWLGGRAPDSPAADQSIPVVRSYASPGVGAGAWTSQEQSLWVQVESDISQGPWPGLRVVALQVDPRTQWGTITLHLPISSRGIPLRDTIQRAALRAGIAALRSPSLRGVTLRITTDTGSTGASAVLFIGDLPSPAPDLDPMAASFAQLSSVFKAPWWSASLGPG